MNIVLGLALYFVIWWMTLFAVLPFGVRSQIEDGSVVSGTEGAAPVRPQILRKFLITAAIAAVLWAIVYLFIGGYLISMDDLPFFTKSYLER